MKETIKNALVTVGNFTRNVLAPFLTGVIIASFIMVLMLGMAFSARSNNCDEKGDWLGYAAQYKASTGCQFKIDGKWVPVDELTFVLKK